jgi:hypothetical protein
MHRFDRRDHGHGRKRQAILERMKAALVHGDDEALARTRLAEGRRRDYEEGDPKTGSLRTVHGYATDAPESRRTPLHFGSGVHGCGERI